VYIKHNNNNNNINIKTKSKHSLCHVAQRIARPRHLSAHPRGVIRQQFLQAIAVIIIIA
jgi:hypothetical protein